MAIVLGIAIAALVVIAVVWLTFWIIGMQSANNGGNQPQQLQSSQPLNSILVPEPNENQGQYPYLQSLSWGSKGQKTLPGGMVLRDNALYMGSYMGPMVYGTKGFAVKAN